MKTVEVITAQKTMIAFWSPNAELWSFLGKVAASSPDLSACYQSIAHLDHITYVVLKLSILTANITFSVLGVSFHQILKESIIFQTTGHTYTGVT